jgi:hypothetical protein
MKRAKNFENFVRKRASLGASRLRGVAPCLVRPSGQISDYPKPVHPPHHCPGSLVETFNRRERAIKQRGRLTRGFFL